MTIVDEAADVVQLAPADDLRRKSGSLALRPTSVVMNLRGSAQRRRGHALEAVLLAALLDQVALRRGLGADDGRDGREEGMRAVGQERDPTASVS